MELIQEDTISNTKALYPELEGHGSAVWLTNRLLLYFGGEDSTMTNNITVSLCRVFKELPISIN